MRLLVLGLVLPALGTVAMAQSVFRGSDFMVLFYGTPCEVPMLAEGMKHIGVVKKAVIVHEGMRIPACYATDEDGDHLLIDTRGNGGWVDGKSVNPGL